MSVYNSSHTGLQIDAFDSKITTLETFKNTLLTDGTTIGNTMMPIYLNDGKLAVCTSSYNDIYQGVLSASDWEYFDTEENILQDITLYKNKWCLEFFSEATITSSTYDALKNTSPRTDIPKRYGYMHTTTSGNLFNVHNYRCRATTYICTNVPKSINFRWASDDDGGAWVNGDYLGLNASCAWSSTYTINLHAGCNEICVIYHEASGGEWFITDPSFETLTDCVMVGIPYGGYRQTITPTVIQGKPMTANTILWTPSIKLNDNTLRTDVFNIKNYAMFVPSSDSLTVELCNNIQPTSDLNCYWLGYNPS